MGNDIKERLTKLELIDSLPEDDRPDADAYVESIISEVGSQIESIKKSLGLPDDAEVTVTQDENGETVVEADGEVVATDEGEAPAEEAPAEENDTNIEDGSKEAEEDEEDEEDSPEDIAAFEEELKNYK